MPKYELKLLKIDKKKYYSNIETNVGVNGMECHDICRVTVRQNMESCIKYN